MKTKAPKFPNIRIAPISLAITIAGLTVALPVSAMDLLEAYSRAQAHDPSYQAAKAERAVNEADITVAKLAYLPTANINFGREMVDNRDRQTYQITQPILDLQKFATLREAAPREVIAEANFRIKEQDLANRVTKVVSEVIKIRESIVLSDEQIKALTEQANRSKRRFELGQGTITEVSTTQVRLDQARATRRQLEAQRAIVEKQFSAIVGANPPAQGFNFVKEPRRPEVEELNTLINKTLSGNAAVLTARANERLAELDKQKIAAGYLPQINAVARTTKLDNQASQNYGGLQLNIPLGVSAANFASQYKAGLAITRAKEVKRDTEEKQKLETERLWALVNAGVEELAIRRDAIRSAELSAEGNIKSYEAGVVTAVDVINAILTVFETKREYLNVLASTTENFLNLQMTVSEPPVEALRKIQVVLLDLRK